MTTAECLSRSFLDLFTTHRERRWDSTTSRMLEAGFTLPEMGKALGVAPTTMRAYRLRRNSVSYRTPPAEWRAQLAALAREGGVALLELARQLEGE